MRSSLQLPGDSEASQLGKAKGPRRYGLVESQITPELAADIDALKNFWVCARARDQTGHIKANQGVGVWSTAFIN